MWSRLPDSRTRGAHGITGFEDRGGIVVPSEDNSESNVHVFWTLISEPRGTEPNLGARVEFALEIPVCASNATVGAQWAEVCVPAAEMGPFKGKEGFVPIACAWGLFAANIEGHALLLELALLCQTGAPFGREELIFQTANTSPPTSHTLSPEVFGEMWVTWGRRTQAPRVTGEMELEVMSVYLNQGLSKGAPASLGLKRRLPASQALGPSGPKLSGAHLSV